jgi:predicted component of viral defense system (DUF524 family)
MAVLYEYWVFFQLLDVVREKVDLSDDLSKQLFSPTEQGLGLRLKRGTQLDLVGVYPYETCPLWVRLSYNRTFSATELRDRMGSWTRNMQPDYTLSFWPKALEEKEAERQSIMVHLHFDAKYRAEQIEDFFGGEKEGAEDLGAERSAERRGVYKRADLLKMHAYRDAILRTEGAYILFPGTEGKTWSREQDQLLPGIGAFAIRPGADGKASGREELSRFLSEVVEHLVNFIMIQKAGYPWRRD